MKVVKKENNIYIPSLLSAHSQTTLSVSLGATVGS